MVSVTIRKEESNKYKQLPSENIIEEKLEEITDSEQTGHDCGNYSYKNKNLQKKSSDFENILLDSINPALNYNHDEKLEILSSMKNSFNNKVLSKRAVGGSCSFRENYMNNQSLSTFNHEIFPKLKGNHNVVQLPNEDNICIFSNMSGSPQLKINSISQSYGRCTHLRRDDASRIIKNNSSGLKNLKKCKNFSVDVHEYSNDEEIDVVKIPINQNHGKYRRGMSSDQMEADNPESLNLLFYDFNKNQNKERGIRIKNNNNHIAEVYEECDETDNYNCPGQYNKFSPVPCTYTKKNNSFDKRKKTNHIDSQNLRILDLSVKPSVAANDNICQRTTINWINKDRLPTRGVYTRGGKRREKHSQNQNSIPINSDSQILVNV